MPYQSRLIPVSLAGGLDHHPSEMESGGEDEGAPAMLTRTVLLRGREAPPPERIKLRAGPLSLVFEEGGLRWFRLADGTEVLNRVYVAVRDRNWNTIPALLSRLEMDVREDRFSIRFLCAHREREIDFRWKGSITGTADGCVVFEMEGEAFSSFLRNRIGFCVLHGAGEHGGVPCRVEHVDGAVEEGCLPDLITPDQPFFDIRAITHQVAPGQVLEVRFDGEAFEMEDQRNWTDASYKTYCTPLRLPMPVEVKTGDRVRQMVRVSLRRHRATERLERSTVSGPRASTARPHPRASAPNPSVNAVNPEIPHGRRLSDSRASIATLPSLGLGLASQGDLLTPREIDRLRALHPAHFRLDLDTGDPEFDEALARGVAQAGAVGVPLEIAITLHGDDPAPEMAAILAATERSQPTVARWIVYRQPPSPATLPWLRRARGYLERYDDRIPVGSGSNANFTELNRDRPPLEPLDFVAFPMNPQIHTFDDGSIAETLAGQRAAVRSAAVISDGLPLAISPVTLRPRFNAVATGPEASLSPDELPWSVDERQMSLFGAAWTLGCIAALARSEVGSLTLYETIGWRGVMERETGAPAPELFRSIPGTVFPLYHVLADVGEFAGAQIVPVSGFDRLTIAALWLRQGRRDRLMIANLTLEPQCVAVAGWEGAAKLRVLDETSAEAAMVDPTAFRASTLEAGADLKLELGPYAIVMVDGG